MVAKKMSLLNWSNIVAFVVTVVVNSLAGSTTLIGGNTTASVSNANLTLITPAGYTFAIWGVIYILLGAFVIYQALPEKRARPFQERIGWLFVASSALNILWLFAWQYEALTVSVALMILLLASLILIYLRLNIGRVKARVGERLAVHLPFSVYLGWITIATIADISATLVSLNWDGFGLDPEIWAVLIVLVATVIASLVAFTRRDIAYELVIVWAFLGIAANQSPHPTIVALLYACAIVVAAVLALSMIYARARPMGKWAGGTSR
jgi:hypothetical protein